MTNQERKGESAVMRDQVSSKPEAQLKMAGMPTLRRRYSRVDRRDLGPGQQVEYLGWVAGGPRFGSQGTVMRALRRKAVVDLGTAGTWNIPYHFLAIPTAA